MCMPFLIRGSTPPTSTKKRSPVIVTITGLLFIFNCFTVYQSDTWFLFLSYQFSILNKICTRIYKDRLSTPTELSTHSIIIALSSLCVFLIVLSDLFLLRSHHNPFSRIVSAFNFCCTFHIGLNGIITVLIQPCKVFINPKVAESTITPASNTPKQIAISASFRRISRMPATSAPVHAPVPGNGIATNRQSPHRRYFVTSLPLMCALFSIRSMIAPHIGCLRSQVNTCRMKSTINGTGIIFPTKLAKNSSWSESP